MHDKHYVITAALRHIWPVDGKLIFPGDWSYRYADIKEIDERGFIREREEQYPFELLCKIRQRYYDYYVGRILKATANMLDKYHGLQIDYHYWEVVLGTWMCFYVMLLAGAYEHVKDIIGKYKACEIIVCSKATIFQHDRENIVGYIDAEGSEKLFAKTDRLNFDFYVSISRILWILSEEYEGINLCEDRIKYVSEKKKYISRAYNKKDKIKENIKNILLGNAKVCGIYDHDSTGNVLLKTKGSIRFDLPQCIYEYSLIYAYDTKLRERLEAVIPGADEFDRILQSEIVKQLPTTVVEEYKDIIRYANKRLPNAPKVVNLQQISDDLSMVMLGEWQKKGTLFAREACSIADQMLIDVENFAYGVDIYYLWSKQVKQPYRTKPTYKRLNHNRWEINDTRNDILWCSCGYGFSSAITSKEGYNNSLCYTQNYMPNFLRSLDERLLGNVVYRIRDIAGWGYDDYYKEMFPSISIDGQNEKGVVGAAWFNFADRCAESRIVVAETLITGVVGETFWIGTPCIIIDPDAYSRRSWWLDYDNDLIAELEACGILYTDSIKAAEFLNDNYDKIEQWWHSKDVQDVISRFMDLYFYETDNMDEWLINEVKELSKL